MKKNTFTLLLLLCLLTITGGTFAAWTYYNGKVESTENLELNKNMDIHTEESSWGTIQVSTNDLAIVIEPTEDKTNYTAKLTFSGSIVANFIPTAKDADLSQFKGWKATVTISKNATFDDSDIFLLGESTIEQEGHEEFSIRSISELKLAKTFKLDSETKAREFEKQLKTTKISIIISEKE